uniref:Integrase catalytic domain-containing protein n=1 Tax=Nosema pernyi TaxID=1112939 RepID=X5E4M6_9MICR|nr:hypothetical protein NP_09H07 [Nosema pernyi]
MDLIEFREEKCFVVVAIDYFTRRVWAKVIRSKESFRIVEFVKSICSEGKVPEEIITDNGKEFCNSEFRQLCSTLKINHRKVSVESHTSNGRVERIIRTIRDSVLKSKKDLFEDKIKEAVEIYNSSFHAGVKCTPIEAAEDKSGTVMIENSPDGTYARNFKGWYREKFIRGQEVRVAKRENLKDTAKNCKGRFLDMGKVLEVCPGDSYIIRLENGKILKKRHYDLKGIR